MPLPIFLRKRNLEKFDFHSKHEIENSIWVKIFLEDTPMLYWLFRFSRGTVDPIEFIRSMLQVSGHGEFPCMSITLLHEPTE